MLHRTHHVGAWSRGEERGTWHDGDANGLFGVAGAPLLMNSSSRLGIVGWTPLIDEK